MAERQWMWARRGVAKPTRSHSRTPVDYAALKDEEVLAYLENGEGWAMAVLYDRYARLVFSLAYKILNDRGASEEVVQEVFVKVWRRAGEYQADKGKFSAWLGGITHHHAIDELRRRRSRPSPQESEETEEAVDSAPAPLETALANQESRRIRDALQAIPADQRRPIEMAYFEGYTQQEIAERLGAPLGTIKTRIRLGMDKLKTLLEEG